jgi:hypothetical protein
MEEKTCTKCKTPKPLEEFSKCGRERRRPNCKSCVKEYHNKTYYVNNKERCKTRAKRNKNAGLQRAYLWVCRYLELHPCVDCGSDDILTLDFDHEDPSSKIDDVMNMIRRGLAWENILAEVAKCSVRCADCHRRRTHRQCQSYRWRYLVARGGVEPPTQGSSDPCSTV